MKAIRMTSSCISGELRETNFLKYLEWEIPDFSHWSQYPYPQEFIISPTFTFENNSWHISLRPYGDLSVFLINETQSPRNINYSFSIKDSNDTLVEYRANNATIYNKSGFTGFYDADDLYMDDEDDKNYWNETDVHFLLPYDTLTIVCILNPGENVEIKQVSNYTPPLTSRMTSSRVGELSERTNLRQLQWKIPNFSHLSCYPYPKKFVNSPTFIFENSSWHISLRPFGDLSVFLINEAQHPCHVNYSFSIKDSKGTLIAYEDNDAFVKNKTGFTNFYDAEILEEEEVLLSDTLTIVCILKPGENEEQTFDCTAPKADDCDSQSKVKSSRLMMFTETDALSRNLKDLFINKDCCDTILRVKDRQFCAHRTILMARSPVFAAMFQQDTTEKRTGIVKINDCDADTFQQFLEYLYSGKIEGVSFDIAFQLYNTSAKYNVQELKMFCAKCMIQNLTGQNIYDVVILANKYDEAILKTEAQDFFNRNVDEILKSNEWGSFLKTNYSLANKLLIAMSQNKAYY